MDYQVITIEEQERARFWYNAAEALRRKANTIIDNLVVTFAKDGDVGLIGLDFKPDPENNHLASVESPTNSGRLTFHYFEEDGILNGKVIVERRGYDHLDRTTWTPVWAITFAPAGAAYVGAPGQRVAFEIEAQFKGPRELAYFKIGMNILFALVAGPLVQ